MRVAALITSFNTWPLALKAVEELQRHSAGELTRILVVDDCSTQPAPAQLPDGVQVHRNDRNRGYVASVNIGVRLLDEDVILLIDSDAYPLMDLAAPARARFQREPRLGVLGFQLRDGEWRIGGGGEPTPTALGLLAGQRLEEIVRELTSHVPSTMVIHSCAMAIRREAFLAIGGFDERFDFSDADIDFCLSMERGGWQVRRDGSLQAVHLGGGSPQTTATRVLRHHRNRWQLLEKHGFLPRGPAQWAFKSGLAARHFAEYALLRATGHRWLSPESLHDKISGRRQLLKEVWSGYQRR